MMNKRSLKGAPGLSWLWHRAYDHGFWGGFTTGFVMSPFLMSVLQLVWTQRIPPWNEQEKGFIVGDVILAIVLGLLAVIASQQAEHEYLPSKMYWRRWLGIGFMAAVLFVCYEYLIGQHTHWWLELEPHLFYHDIVLFIVLVPLIMGGGYVLCRRRPQDKLWAVIGILLTVYIGLQVYDLVRPPRPHPPPRPHSAETWFLRRVHCVDYEC